MVDIGCGEGSLASELASTDFFSELVGMEVSGSGVLACTERRIPNASFERFDGSTIPYPDQSFDLAVLSHVVEHLPDPRSLIREAARVGRFVIVEVPLEHRFLRPRKDFEWTAVGHINFYDRKLIRFLVQSCGLTVVDERLSNPDRRSFTNRSGDLRGSLQWLMREAALRVSPTVATTLVTFHNALLATGSLPARAS